MLLELDGNNVAKAEYTYGDEILSQKRGNTVSFYFADGHGDIRILADIDENITDTYDYDAFGNLTNQTGTTENSYLYCGEQYDGTTGYYYLRARYMDPTTGVFTTMDTYQGNINDPVSLHKYLYAGASPVMNVDPSGNMFFPIVDGAIEKIKSAWDKMVVGYGETLTIKIGINTAIYTTTMYYTTPALRENMLCLITGRPVDENAKGVFGEGIGFCAAVGVGISIQIMIVWDSKLNFGLAIMFSSGGGLGMATTNDFIYFPDMDTIDDLRKWGGGVGVGGPGLYMEFEMTPGHNGVSVSSTLWGAYYSTFGRGFFENALPDFSFMGKGTYTWLFYKYSAFDIRDGVTS